MPNEARREPEAAREGFSRRTLMIGGAVGLAGAVVAGCSGDDESQTTQASDGSAAAEGEGGTLIWATHAIGEWNFPLEVGFHDFTEKYGWEFQKVGVPETQYSVENAVNSVRDAIQSEPTAIVATMVDAAVAPALRQAQEAGIYVIVNNSDVPDERRELGLSYVGQSMFDSGVLNGTRICEEIDQAGRKDGVIVSGIGNPGQLALEERYRGTAAGVEAYNRENGTSFTSEKFPDQAADIAAAIPIYTTKMTQLGDRLAAFASVGLPSVVANYQALQEAGREPGEILVGGFDTGPDINEGIKGGYIQFVVDQQLYSQGFVPAALAWQDVVKKCTPTPDYDTGNAVVDESTIDTIIERDDAIAARAQELGLRAS